MGQVYVLPIFVLPLTAFVYDLNYTTTYGDTHIHVNIQVCTVVHPNILYMFAHTYGCIYMRMAAATAYLIIESDDRLHNRFCSHTLHAHTELKFAYYFNKWKLYFTTFLVLSPNFS